MEVNSFIKDVTSKNYSFVLVPAEQTPIDRQNENLVKGNRKPGYAAEPWVSPFGLSYQDLIIDDHYDYNYHEVDESRSTNLLEYDNGDIELEYLDHEPLYSRQGVYTPFDLVTSTSDLSHRFSPPSSAKKLQSSKSAPYLPPKHGINGLDLMLTGGFPSTYQTYLRKKNKIAMPDWGDMPFQMNRASKFTGNLLEDPKHGTWSGSSDWVKYWIND